MKAQPSRTRLAREFDRLFRCMDFVARHPALKSGRGVEAKRLAELYQQLGVAWEFLALQCAHEKGFSKIRDGKHTCSTCGTLEDATEGWVLLPRTGKKQIGRRRFPDAVRAFANRKARRWSTIHSRSMGRRCG